MEAVLTRPKRYNKKEVLVKRGDIIWLKEPLPFLEELGENVQYVDRPYIVISNDINNDRCPTINLACISKQISKANYPMHVYLDKKKYNLLYDSVIYTEQIITVNKSFVKNVVANLDKTDLKKLNRAIYIQMINERCNLSLI